MAQIAITLAPALSVELMLTGAASTATVGKPPAVVGTALYELMRGPPGVGDPNALPAADALPTPTQVIVLQGGVWVRASWAQFAAWMGSVAPVTGMTINGEPLTINGETLTVNGA